MSLKPLCAVVMLSLFSPFALANTITSEACAPGTRVFSVTANTVSGCLAVGTGNINGNPVIDPFLSANPGWVLIDKSDDNAGANNGWLTGAPSLTSGLSGTFNINPLAYTTFDDIAIGFKSGQGMLNPDWAIFALVDNTLIGTWSISGQQALSHANLYGRGTPSTDVPEPGTLSLLGIAGLASVALRRRRSASGAS
jgi:hypothetical protein